MKAVILAGGAGSRLKKISGTLPKALVPIGDYPVVEHQIRLLARYGFTEITLATGYGAESLWNYCGTGEWWGVHIGYSHEETPLGTGGALKLLVPQPTEDFLLLCVDIMLEMNLEKLAQFHRQHQPLATMVAQATDHPHDSDLLEVNMEGKITAIFPKPHSTGHYPNLSNAGVSVISPRIFEFLPEGFSLLEKDGLRPALLRGEKLMGYKTEEYLKDMGTEERYHQVTADYENGLIWPLTRST